MIIAVKRNYSVSYARFIVAAMPDQDADFGIASGLMSFGSLI